MSLSFASTAILSLCEVTLVQIVAFPCSCHKSLGPFFVALPDVLFSIPQALLLLPKDLTIQGIQHLSR